MIKYLPLFLMFACDDAAKDDTHTGTHDDTGMTAMATCPDYCTTFLANCSADASNTYADQADCETKCGTWEQGEAGATSGNSLECRAYHADAAASDAALHCPHASEAGTGGCE